MTDDIPEGGGGRSLMDRLVHAMGGGPRDRDELLEVVRDAQSRELFDADTLQMVEGVFQVVEMRVRDIMIPRGQMVVVEREATLGELLPLVVESGHSRFPVIDEDKDNIVGVLLAKDLLKLSAAENALARHSRTEAAHLGDGHADAPGEAGDDAPGVGTPGDDPAAATLPFRVADVMREATFTPETKRLNVLLKEFRSARSHMAIVLDEYGGTAGLVTIEDVLEEIVGEIDDEHDSEEEDVDIRSHGDGRYSVRALTPIDEFNEALGTAFGTEEFDTIGGLLMQHIGHMPKTGESAEIDGCQFRVLAADSRRLHLLQVVPPGR